MTVAAAMTAPALPCRLGATAMRAASPSPPNRTRDWRAGAQSGVRCSRTYAHQAEPATVDQHVQQDAADTDELDTPAYDETDRAGELAGDDELDVDQRAEQQDAAEAGAEDVDAAGETEDQDLAAAAASDGAEDVDFRVALNVGHEARPLSRVASGGELSRVMLALKTILARLDAVPTLVFDEVDAGIGGRVGLQVGDTMRRVAEHHQVFAISHLPQLAARAHHHIQVAKGARGGVTTADVRVLDGLETPVSDSDTLMILPAMAGG